MAAKEVIFKILERLTDKEFEKFKWFLQHPDTVDGISIPKSYLDKANRCDTVDRIVGKYNHQSVEVVKTTLQKINRNDLVERLSSTSTGTQGSITTKSSTSTHSGSPTQHQLRPKEEKIGTLTRKTVGERNYNKINKSILLVGETGAGKSTLINTLVNYAMGVKFEDDIWFKITEDEKRSQSESQTSDVVVYEIFGFEGQTLPFSLTVIDTPGYGDTRDIERDLNISDRLLDLFRSEEGVHELSAVGLVMKASENRLSDRLMYIFSSVMSLFGNDMENNIVALITHSDGRKPKSILEALEAAKIKCARDEKNERVHFLFDNCQHEDRTEDRDILEKAVKIGISQFIDFLEKTAPQKLEKTVNVLNEHVRLKACLENLQERVEFIEQKQTEIRQMKEALEKHEEEMKVPVIVDEVYKDKQRIPGGRRWFGGYDGAVTCNICEENCHYPGCTMASSPRQCEAMKDGCCTVCTDKCPVSDHVKEDKIYVSKTRKVNKTLQDMKDKYDKNKAERVKKSSLLKNLEKETKDLIVKKDQCLKEAYHHVIRLDQIALKVGSVSTHVHIDFLIEKMKEKRDTEKIQKLEKMKGRVDERSCGGIQYGSQSDLEKTQQRPKPRHQDTVSAPGITMATASNVSEKYKDIISKYSLIHPGSPALHQLRPKEEKIETLTRKTLGEKKLDKVNKTILLVGETGTGKSTLINTLFNYAMGVEFEDNIWFEIVEENKRSQTESQTSDVVVYEIFGFEENTLPFSLTIIDTPGFGDTKNAEHDLKVTDRLFDLFRSEEGVHELSAVGLVMKATENRLSDRQMYIFNSVMSLFGNDMENNIVALITHSDGITPKNALKALDAAGIKCARNQENQPVYFLFDNKQTTERTKETELSLEFGWKITMGGLSQFKDFLERTPTQKLKKTVEVLNEQVRLKACIENLQKRVEFIEKKQTEISQMKEGLEKHKDKIKKNEKFTVEIDEVYKEKEEIYGGWRWIGGWSGAITCNICKENCHHPCRMSWFPSSCKVLRGGCCTVCTNKCPVSDHVKQQWIYISKTRKVEKTLQDMKDKYEKNKAGKEKKLSLLENLEKEMKELTAKNDQWLEESYQHLIRLDQIALNVDSVSTHVHLDFLIEKMKEKGDTEKIQKLEEMKERVDERSRRGIEYASKK